MPDTLDHKLVLTTGEKLFLRRRRDGLSQKAQAKALGFSLTGYGLLELDKEDAPPLAPGEEPNLGVIKDHERCVIWRRRVGKKQSDIAADLDCCRMVVNLMEQGKKPCADLLQYWEF